MIFRKRAADMWRSVHFPKALLMVRPQPAHSNEQRVVVSTTKVSTRSGGLMKSKLGIQHHTRLQRAPGAVHGRRPGGSKHEPQHRTGAAAAQFSVGAASMSRW